MKGKQREITVVLLRAEHPGNVGAVARAMKNFGYDRLVLVDPQCDYLCEEARRRAKHAGEVLDNAQVMKSLSEVGVDTLVATSGKVGTDYNLPRTPLTPKEFSGVADGNVGLVFGPESSGLLNDEVEACDVFVSIPASEEYPVLNLSHAVTVLLYELATTAAKKNGNEGEGEEEFTPASAQDKKILLGLIDETLDTVEFETAEKRKTQEILWKRVLGKAFLTKREAFGLMGYFKKTLGKR